MRRKVQRYISRKKKERKKERKKKSYIYTLSNIYIYIVYPKNVYTML